MFRRLPDLNLKTEAFGSVVQEEMILLHWHFSVFFLFVSYIWISPALYWRQSDKLGQ